MGVAKHRLKRLSASENVHKSYGTARRNATDDSPYAFPSIFSQDRCPLNMQRFRLFSEITFTSPVSMPRGEPCKLFDLRVLHSGIDLHGLSIDSMILAQPFDTALGAI